MSFDFCFTKALEGDEKESDVSSSTWLVMADSHSGYLGCCPLRGKGQIKLATHEVMAFTQSLGYSAVCFSTDNEPTTRQILRCLINARHAMGLPTRIGTSKIADHSNALAENAVNRIRGLTCTLMEEVQAKIGMKLNTNNTIWSWAARHASWLLNRYCAVRGATPYELVYGKPYRGVLGKFAEPVYAYLKTHLKGEKKWHKALFLGKTEGQDSFIVYDGTKVLLTKSIRRIGRDWGLSLAYFKEFNCPTFDYQTGFGSRIIPTKREAVALPALPNLVPLESIAVKAKDLEAEAVIKKAIEENREEDETKRMSGNDPREGVFEAAPREDGEEDPPRRIEGGGTTSNAEATFSSVTSTLSTNLPRAMSTTREGKEAEKNKEVLVVDDNTPLEALMQPGALTIEFKPSGGASSSAHSAAGEARSSPTTRSLEEKTEEREGKKQRTEDVKKARINRMQAEMEEKIRTITVGDEVFYTLDEELEAEKDDDLDWDSVEVQIPEELWTDGTQDEKPKEPEAWIDSIADQVELNRLVSMEVIKQASDEDKDITRSVTTKFVRDWRWKEWKGEGPPKNRWLRRSRLVAREYAVDKRDDVFSPASSGHLLRLLPVLYLAEVGELKDAVGRSDEEVMLSTMDIKDAFLQVPQEEPLRLKMQGGDFIVLKNLPGQMIGAKAWFDYFSKFLAEELGFEACRLNPCLLRSKKAVLLVHVDDVMVKGESKYILQEFVPKVRSKFDASLSTMTKVGEKISFLKRTYQRLEDGILITPGHNIENMLEVFEGYYGMVRAQKVPCDGSIQVEDVSLELDVNESTIYRSLVGMATLLSRSKNLHRR